MQMLVEAYRACDRGKSTSYMRRYVHIVGANIFSSCVPIVEERIEGMGGKYRFTGHFFIAARDH